MVFSKLNEEVEYIETLKIDPEDKGHQSTIYDIELFDKPIVITIGKPKYTFSRLNITFYPIYIVSINNTIEGQIGVFEIEQTKSLKIFDEDGDIDVEKLGAPILYESAEKMIRRSKSDVLDYLAQWNKDPNTPLPSDGDSSLGDPIGDLFEKSDESDEVMELNIPEEKGSKQLDKTNKILEKGYFMVDEALKPPELLPEESESDANNIKKEYIESTTHSWIQKFMKNPNYKIQNVESNGDCFFAVIRDAFKQIGHTTTVHILRAIVAKSATDQVFQNYRALYLSLSGIVKNCDMEMSKIKKLIDVDLKKRSKNAQDNRSEMDEISAEVDRLKLKYTNINNDKIEASKLLTTYLGNLNDIDTLEKFREYIQTSMYWADSWAISILERELSIKMIIFSEISYNEISFDSILTCGEIDPTIQAANTFTPKHYIMTTYSGSHYRLVNYKKRSIFKFQEIPYHVKILIINKCIEKNPGIFYLIPDFRNFTSALGIDPDIGKPIETDEDEMNLHLYDPSVIFMFHVKSEKTAKPGKGANETIPLTKRTEFITLGRIADWRRQLDDSWEQSPFKLDGHKWASVEHYYQGSKFKKGFPDFYQQFSLDSDSDISKDVVLAKHAGSKKGTLTLKGKPPKILRPKSIVIDPDFYGERSKKEREMAVRSKFAQNEDLKQLLLNTKTAKLIQFIPRNEPETDIIIMKIRKELSSNNPEIIDLTV